MRPHPRSNRARFGKWVREQRLALGLSQESLAWACGYEQNWVSRLELGYRVTALSADDFLLLCRALGQPTAKALEKTGHLVWMRKDLPYLRAVVERLEARGRGARKAKVA